MNMVKNKLNIFNDYCKNIGYSLIVAGGVLFLKEPLMLIVVGMVLAIIGIVPKVGKK